MPDPAHGDALTVPPICPAQRRAVLAEARARVAALAGRPILAALTPGQAWDHAIQAALAALEEMER